MKGLKTFIIADVIIFLIKVLGGLLCNSYTMIASSLYDLGLIIVTLVTLKINKNNKLKGILSSFLGFVMILLGIGIIFISNVIECEKTSFFIILFVIISLIVRYIVSCFYTNISYQRKEGLLTLGTIKSNIDFISYGVIFGALILSKLSKWIDIFKYADRLGTALLALLVIFKGIKIIINSFKYLEDKEEEIKEEFIQEITARKEIKKLEKLNLISYGGIRKVNCNLVLNDGISMVDINTFVVTLQDYLLKIADVVKINLVMIKQKNKPKVRVRSLKQDARNSRSRNGKTNVKAKNIKQKNKKR